MGTVVNVKGGWKRVRASDIPSLRFRRLVCFYILIPTRVWSIWGVDIEASKGVHRGHHNPSRGSRTTPSVH